MCRPQFNFAFCFCVQSPGRTQLNRTLNQQSHLMKKGDAVNKKAFAGNVASGCGLLESHTGCFWSGLPTLDRFAAAAPLCAGAVIRVVSWGMAIPPAVITVVR